MHELSQRPPEGVVLKCFLGDLFSDAIDASANATDDRLTDTLIDDTFDLSQS